MDICHQLEMITLIKELQKQEGLGIVIVLHDIAQAMDISDRVIVLANGKQYAAGKPETVINPAMLAEVYKVQAKLLKIAGRRRPLIDYTVYTEEK